MGSDERKTDSGIFLPVPDNGHPIAQLILENGQFFNVVAATDDELDELAERVTAFQEAAERGEAPALFEFREPQFGTRCYLTREGVKAVRGVQRAYAAVIDPMAEIERRQEQQRMREAIAIARPGRPRLH